MDLALHIGTTKTGTTSLQRWFADNRAALAQQGIRYPVSLGHENHKKLMVYARDTDRPDVSFAQMGVNSAADHEAFRERLNRAFQDEIVAQNAIGTGMRAWVISNEHLYVKINTPAMVARVHGFLAPWFDRITVYLHLRPQVDLLVSNASQRARLGQLVSYETLTRRAVGPNSAYFNYDHVVRIWSAIFGAEAIRVVPFRRFPSMADLLIRDLDIDTAPLTEMERLNTSLDWRTIALANVVHAGMAETAADGRPDVVLPTAGPGRAAAAALPELFLDEMPGTQGLQIGSVLAREIQSRFDKPNADLIARTNSLEPGDLTPDWAKYDGKPNVHMLTADCHFKDQLAFLVQKYTNEINGLRLRLKRAGLDARPLDAKLADGPLQADDPVGSEDATKPESGRILAVRPVSGNPKPGKTKAGKRVAAGVKAGRGAPPA